jgi:hypothetical protein
MMQGITTTRSHKLKAYPYVMRYQLIGYSKQTEDIFGNFSRSRSLTSFYESPADLQFNRQYYVNGFAWATFTCLEIQAAEWSGRRFLKNEKAFASARFDFHAPRTANNDLVSSASLAIQPAAQTAGDPSSGFSIFLTGVGVLTWTQQADPFFNSKTILFAYRRAQWSGNIPPHLHPRHR